MTWDQLKKHIEQMSTEQLHQDVTIYDASTQEFLPALSEIKFAKPGHEVLDPAHPFLVIFS